MSWAVTQQSWRAINSITDARAPPLRWPRRFSSASACSAHSLLPLGAWRCSEGMRVS